MPVLLFALGLDLLLGEPPAPAHPVVWLGRAIDLCESHAPPPRARSSLLYGAAAAFALPAFAAAAALGAERSVARLPCVVRPLARAALLKPAFALRLLLGAGASVRLALAAGDLEGARRELRRLVSRPVAALSPEQCAAAAIESLAENLTDSVVAPWLAWSLLGLPGAWAFRAANTLDSRWGYRGRYEWLGRAAARLDDALCYLPARLSALLLVVATPAGRGSPLDALRLLRRDHSRTASPNAGWTMSAIAGALGRRLEKPDHYILNRTAPPPSAEDIRRAERIVRAAALLAAPLALCLRRLARAQRIRLVSPNSCQR